MKKFETETERKAFYSGVAYTKSYIGFCMKNYAYQFNLGGIRLFINDLINFINGVNYIPNTYNNMTFKQFCENYEVEEK